MRLIRSKVSLTVPFSLSSAIRSIIALVATNSGSTGYTTRPFTPISAKSLAVKSIWEDR